MTSLTIIRGIPGAGKSTKARDLIEKNLADVHLEADMYHIVDGEYNWKPENVKNAHFWCMTQTKMYLSQGKRVVVSNTFVSLWELKPYFEICQEFGIVPNVIVCDGEFTSIHSVPESVVNSMKERFQHDISSLIQEHS